MIHDRVRATFELEPHGSAEALLVEETCGTPWLPAPAAVAGEVVAEGDGIAVIDFPAANYPTVTNLLAALVAGEAVETRDFERCRLVGLEVPAGYLPGPAFPAPERVLVGAILKPSLGLDPAGCAAVAAELAAGGADLVKDDELAGDTHLCPLESRVAAVASALPTGTRYYPNITGAHATFLQRAERAVALGASGLMVNGFVQGLDAVRALREADFGVPVLCHRVGTGAWMRNDHFGVSPAVVAQLQRLAGADVVLVGAYGGKLFDRDDDVHEAVAACHRPLPGAPYRCLAALGGGVGPGNAAELVDRAGGSNGVVVLLGSSAYRHPGGVRAGVRATVDALVEARR